MNTERDFTPALPVMWAYDPIVATLTRENVWRGALLRQVAPCTSDVVVDVGCGTGSFLALLGSSFTPRKVIGIDPDPEALKRARVKLVLAGVEVTLERGYLRDVANAVASARPTKIVTSLVLHQVPLSEKRAGFSAMYSALQPGGELHVADYGLQRTWLARRLFNIVQLVDGFADTQPNADGVLPFLMKEAGFENVEETHVFPTLTGSISLYRGVRPRASEGT